MRRSALIICSTAHIPLAERRAIDRLIAEAPRVRGGRGEVDHPDLVIEPYAYGYFAHCGIVGCGGDEAPDISPELWTILVTAFEGGASWVLLDRDEPVSANFPYFADP